MIRVLLVILSIQSAVYSFGQQAASQEVMLMRERQFRERVSLKILPSYPVKALPLGAEGVIVSEVEFDRRGTVTHVQIIESGNQLFNEPTISALKRWKFRPIVAQGKTFGGKSKITLYFYCAHGHGWVEDPLIFKNEKKAPTKSAQNMERRLTLRV